MSSCAKAVSRAIMRAVKVHQFGGPEVLQVETNVPIPEPAGSQVLVEVKAAGINPVDTYVRTGTYPIMPHLPYTPGSDAAGLVKAVGPTVTKVKPGDRVYLIRTLTGSYAEYSLADEEMVQPLSEKLTFQQGAGLGVPCYSAYRALCIKARDKIKPGTTVLIHGASGAVGLACVQIAAARGLTVIGTAGSQAGLHLIMQHGASAAFNHQEPSYIDQIVAASGGVGPDVIIEMLANVNLEKDLMMAARNARIVVVGNRGSLEINPRLLMQKEVLVTGMALMNATEDEWREMHAGVADGVRQGWLQPHICKEYPLEEAPTAHHDVIHAGASLGKRVFVL